MRFADFLRTTVLISAGAATALAAVTVAGAAGNSNDALVPLAAAWWVIAALIGLWLGRRADASPPIATLLANDYDSAGATLSIVGFDTSILMGTLNCTADPTACTYTPPGNAYGYTLFRYTVSDTAGWFVSVSRFW